jgi:hypothetical protein
MPLIRALPRISARPFGLEEFDEVNPTEWKVDSFITLAHVHFAKPAGQTVFSLGDSAHEREAVRRTSERLGIVAQSVKLLDHPSLETLDAEHASLQNGLLRDLLNHVESFDFYFEDDTDPQKLEAQSVQFGGQAPFAYAETPVVVNEFASWSDLIEAESLNSELNKTHKSTSSTSSTVSTATSENAESPAELSSDWSIMV